MISESVSQGSHKDKPLAIEEHSVKFTTFSKPPSCWFLSMSKRSVVTLPPAYFLNLIAPRGLLGLPHSITDCLWFFLPLKLASSHSIYSRTFMLSIQFIISFLNPFKMFIFSMWPSAPFLPTFIPLYLLFFFQNGA